MKIKKWEHFVSIKTSMTYSFLTLIIGALLVFLIVSLTFTKENILNNAIFYSQQNVTLINHEIDSYIDYMENISMVVADNDDVTQYLFPETDKEIDQEAKGNNNVYQRIIEQFSLVMKSRSDIANIGIILNDDIYIINDTKGELNQYVNQEEVEWIRNTKMQYDRTYLSTSHVQNLVKDDYRWVITLSRPIRNPYTNVREALFFIDLNYDFISDLCDNNIASERGYVFILDEDGQVIYHPKQQLLYSGLVEENIKQVMENEEGYFVTSEKDSRLYTMVKSQKTGWTVVQVAYENDLMKDRYVINYVFYITAGILILIAVIVANFFSQRITQPIRLLKESMKEVEKGHFVQANVPVLGKNEIGDLSRSFNLMTSEIQNLMEQVIKEQEAKRKSELKALQSQINPHFLYNTLDSIIWMAENEENDDVVLMTSSLAHMMRQSFNNKDELTSIENEIEHVKSYLTIQKMRYKDKLTFEIEVEPKLLSCNIIKLVLQPLVENAIYHGIKYKEGIGLVSIKGYLENDIIIFEITDNGAGMDQEHLQHIFDEHKVNYSSNGVGVYNVQKRLNLYYGKDFGLQYESKLHEGTKVTLRIPGEGNGNAV